MGELKIRCFAEVARRKLCQHRGKLSQAGIAGSAGTGGSDWLKISRAVKGVAS
jgi:hypothetical protein